MDRIYLDSNGSYPVISEAKEKVVQLVPLLGNPSSFHEHGRTLRALIDDARDLIALSVNARPKDLIFTSGASEANRLFIDALILKSRQEHKPLNVVISPFEHPSLLKPALRAHDEGFFHLHVLSLDANGQLIFDNVIKSADVVMCCQAHNETGILLNLDELLGLVSPKTLVMSDISQGCARLIPPPERIDVLSFSAQKMGGFAGLGGLVLRGHAKNLTPPWLGGGQERGFRPGTESTLLIAAFGEAARHIEETRRLNRELGPVRDYFERLLGQLNCRIIADTLPRLPNTSAICFTGQNPDALRIACDLAGLSVGFGAACSGLAPEGSFALKRLGLSLEDEKTTVRFSLAPGITTSDMDEVFLRLKKTILK